jgi:predicted RNase H-like nuclease (RuvC/YqgF family)
MRNEERTTMTDEKTRMTNAIGKLLGWADRLDLTNCEDMERTASALESLVTARAMLGEEATLTNVVDAAAARFDARPLHRASIEARAELAGEPDQLATLRPQIEERDARIRELEDRIEQLERESNDLTVRLQLARSEPRRPGLTQEQAKLLKRTVHNTLTGEVCDGAIVAIDANTAGAR